jgi:hypothetical protein
VDPAGGPLPVPLIWIGALSVFVGVLVLATKTLWRGRLTDRHLSSRRGPTLEPPRSEAAAGFSPRANWPGLALIGAGLVLLLLAAM